MSLFAYSTLRLVYPIAHPLPPASALDTYSGNVLGLNISCEQCNSAQGASITLQQAVAWLPQGLQASGASQPKNIVDTFFDPNSGNVFALIEQGAYYFVQVLNNSLAQEMLPTQLPQLLTKNFSCPYLLPNFDSAGKLVEMFAVCQQFSPQNAALLPIRYVNEEFQSASLIQLLDIQQLGGIAIENGTYLFALNRAATQTNGVYLYVLGDYLDEFPVANGSVTARAFTCKGLTVINTFAVQLLPDNQTYAVFMGTNQAELLYGYFDATNLAEFYTVTAVVLSYAVTSTGYYLPQSSAVLKIIPTTITTPSAWQAIFVFDGAPIYWLSYFYNQTTEVTSVVTTFSQLGANSFPASVKWYGNYLAVLFRDNKVRTFTIGLFLVNQLAPAGQINFVIGGVSVPFTNANSNFVGFNFFWNPQLPQQVNILNINPNTGALQAVALNESYYLVIENENGENVRDQAVTFSLLAPNLLGDAPQFSVPLSLVVPDNTSSSSFPGWAIALIVIGGLLVIALITWLIIRHRKNKPNLESGISQPFTAQSEEV